jgi:hypothetical protein
VDVLLPWLELASAPFADRVGTKPLEVFGMTPTIVLLLAAVAASDRAATSSAGVGASRQPPPTPRRGTFLAFLGRKKSHFDSRTISTIFPRLPK